MIRHILQDSKNLLAMADMHGNLVAVAVLLVLGVVLLRLVSPVAEASTPRRWLVATAFVGGPAAALSWFFADILWISPHDYLAPKDYADSLLPILIIGIIGGTIGSAAIWLGECMSCCLGRKRSSSNTNGANEQSNALEPAAGPDSNGASSPPPQ